MISTVQKFGAFVLIDDPLCLNADNEAVPEICESRDCAIPNTWCAVKLIEKYVYNHDTAVFRFRLPENAKKLNLPVGGYLLGLAPASGHNGKDAIRPYTSISDEYNQTESTIGTFDILCKRYDQWGEKEKPETHFLFTRTDHSYRPPGACSNYIHKLNPGDTLCFKHDSSCKGRVGYPISGVRTMTLIAVGVGIAPMIQLLRAVIRDHPSMNHEENAEESTATRVEKVVLLYGVRTVTDILLREQLEEWQSVHGEWLTVVFCVGSRWSNVHWGVKKGSEYKPPPPPLGFETLRHAEHV